MKGFLEILAGIAVLFFGVLIVYFWILNIFNPEYHGYAKGILLVIGGAILFFGYFLVGDGYHGMRKRKESSA